MRQVAKYLDQIWMMLDRMCRRLFGMPLSMPRSEQVGIGSRADGLSRSASYRIETVLCDAVNAEREQRHTRSAAWLTAMAR